MSNTNRSRLAYDEIIRLHQWVNGPAVQALLEEGISKTDLAAKATEELGLDISASTVATYAKKLGIEIGKKKEVKEKSDSTKSEILELRAIVEDLAVRLLALEVSNDARNVPQGMFQQKAINFLSNGLGG